MINRPKNIILDDVFLTAQKGDAAYLLEIYGISIERCDICGKIRICTLYISSNNRGIVFIAACKKCSKRLGSEDDT